MNQTHSQFSTKSGSATGPRIAIVSASWHRDIVANATTAIRAELNQSNAPPLRLDHFEVPGAFEIPLHAQRLARSGAYDAIIACALVVNGGIYRHEFVASAVIDALMRVQLDTDTPVFSAVLTPRDFHEHDEHRQFFAQHFVKKGREAAQACLQTLSSLQRLAS
ncbi:6,7-dimethyl-8-ribityllumazine synthase [Roseateles sp. BYS180W]|uniref:6,7-dimethyl-8-ribityllumazine synthase n=1 Tax=Roseateles rivi TaxID=3299028 RepID=A0ABW7FQT5_9BURK